MFNYYLPYGKKRIKITVPYSADLLKPKKIKVKKPLDLLLYEALQNPMNHNSLSEFLEDKNNIAISIEDDTRPINNKEVLRILFNYLREKGIKKKSIKIIVATGLHHDKTLYDFSDISYDFSVEVIKHNPDNDLVFIEDENLGKVGINREFIKADARIIIGDVVPHQIFGFSGPPKSIIPGLSDRETINKTHKQVLFHELKAGIENNIVLNWVINFSKKIPNIFSINLIQDVEKNVLNVITGEIVSSFEKAIKKSKEIYCVEVDKEYDVVITSPGGYPEDQDLYQTQKAFRHASYITKEGGKIIVFAPCSRGWGSEDFKKITEKIIDVDRTIEELRNNFSVGKHKLLFFLELSKKYKLFLYSDYDFSQNISQFITKIKSKNLSSTINKEDREIVILYGGNFLVPALKKS
ncbi:MAG: nickel-dependent lactate racemase [Dictyoglomaceae bacterium]